MRDSTVEGFGFCMPRQWHESLPGQKQLFSERESDATTDALVGTMPNRELFPTGRDLPGASESDQAILWDVE